MWYWVLSLVKTLERCFSFSVNDTGGLGEKSENSQQESNLSIPFHPIPTHSTPHHSILFCSTLTSWISRASPWSISSTLKNHSNQIFLWYIQLHEDFLLQAIISPRDPFRRWCLKQVQSNLSLRTPLYCGQFVWSQKCKKLHSPATSIIRTPL